MAKGFQIGEFFVDDPFQPYIIAEIGVNHEGNMDLAKRMIREAAEAGASAAKFQSYKAEKLASKNSPAYWDTSKEKTLSQYELFKKYDSFSEADYIELATYCIDLGIDFMSTPFDLGAVDFLDPLMNAFKIASADITNVPLLRKCASKGKPIILSTGAATLPEIEYAMETIKAAGNCDIALLHCVLNYPTAPDNANLKKILALKKVYPDYVIGYSDHVVPDETITALQVACLYGAAILEKHFTFDRNLPGNDHYHAMDKNDLRNFVEKLNSVRVMSGEMTFEVKNQTDARIHARRSIFSLGEIRKGDVFSETNLIAKRPGHGISPVLWDEIIGKAAACDIENDQLISWEMIV